MFVNFCEFSRLEPAYKLDPYVCIVYHGIGILGRALCETFVRILPMMLNGFKGVDS